MRLPVVCLAGLLLAAGCGSTHSESKRRQTSGGTLSDLIARPGEDVAVVAGDADFAPGTIRYSFLVVRHDAKPVSRPRARVWLATARRAKPFLTATAALEPVGIPGVSEAALGDVTALYVVRLKVPRPGRFWLVAEPVGGKPIQALGILDVKAHTTAPPVGARATASRTPTLASTGGDTAKLTTRRPPDRALLRYSVAESLRAHRPFVLVFATPALCESRTCGPVVDVADYVRRQFAGSGIRFIHVEVYKDNRKELGYNRWMREWRLPSEPWTFLVGRDGRIKARFEGSVSASELAAAVRRYLA